MKVIIVEDEIYARENLERILLEIDPNIQIVERFDTVAKTVSWLKHNTVDLLLLDIHLADDISFSIFDQVEVNTPVIFTTAYDEFTLKAFKVNSVDYLLKPIEKEELSIALDKFHRLAQPAQVNWQQLQSMFNQPGKPNYQKRFLVQRRDKMMPIKVEEVAYFEAEDRYVSLVQANGSKYIIDYKLADLEGLLDPAQFFRLNRSYITHIDAIDQIVVVSNSRVKVYLKPVHSREIIVSTQNTREFKKWLNR